MRSLDYSDSRKAKETSKATDMPKPSNSLDGVTLWGTTVGGASETAQRYPTPRSNHYQNAPSPTSDQAQLRGHNHQQNAETSQMGERRKLHESRINESHMSSVAPASEKSTKARGPSRINEGTIVFGASDAPKRAPPPRVEPFQEAPRRGHVKQVLPGYSDASKFSGEQQ
jgi:hypothetical protein